MHCSLDPLQRPLQCNALRLRDIYHPAFVTQTQGLAWAALTLSLLLQVWGRARPLPADNPVSCGA